MEVDSFWFFDSPLFGKYEGLIEQRVNLEQLLNEGQDRSRSAAADRGKALYDQALADYRTALGAKDAYLRTWQNSSSESTHFGPACRVHGGGGRGGPCPGWRNADAAIVRFDQLATTLTTATPPAPAPLLAAALREGVHADEAKAFTHVLFVGVESAGGETITKRSFWPWRNSARFVGGMQLSYLMLDVKEKKLVAGGTKPLLGHIKFTLGDMTGETIKTVKLET